MAAGNTGGRSTDVGGLFLVESEPAVEEAAPLAESVVDAVGEIFAALVAMCVAPVVLETERRVRAARARRSATVRKAA